MVPTVLGTSAVNEDKAAVDRAEERRLNVYLVVDDFGRNGCVYRETDVETADLETVNFDLFAGQHRNPIRVVASTRRGLVARRLGRYRPRTASPLRSADAGRTVRHSGLRRAPRGSRPSIDTCVSPDPFVSPRLYGARLALGADWNQ